MGMLVTLLGAGAALTSTPAAQPAGVLPVGNVCTLVAAPGNAFSFVAPPPQARLQADALDAATVIVTYTGFESFPAAQAAFQAAVDIWSSVVSSPVPIRVNAQFAPLASNVLGQAGAQFIWQNFPNAPVSNTFYYDALADKLRGADNYPGQADIVATFNSSFSNWYFGTDGFPPAGTYDFVSVVLHELGHGLGFAGRASVSGGVGTLGSGPYGSPATYVPYIYDRFASSETGTQLLAFLNPSAALGTQLTRAYDPANPQGPGVFWNGPSGVAANGGMAARLNTPATWQPGSSYSHFDESYFLAGNPNSLMTPALSGAEAIHNPGPITLGMFADMGWSSSSPVVVAPAITSQPSGQTVARGQSATLNVVATGTAPFAYQWYQGASPNTALPIAGAAGPTYVTPPLFNTTSYWVRVSNSAGSANSQTATVVPVQVGHDFNGDTIPDLLFESTTGDLYAWFLNGTTLVGGSWLSPSQVDPAWLVVGTSDFTGDGKADVLLQNQQNSSIRLDKMDGLTKIGEQVIPIAAGSPWKVVATADFNGDQHTDIAWENFGTGQIYIWFMRPQYGNAGYGGAGGEFSGDYLRDTNQSILTLGPTTMRVVGAADMDRDNDIDIVWQDESSYELGVWYLNGLTRTSASALTPGKAAAAWRVRVVGDYNADGWADLIWQNTANGDLYAWFLTGSNMTSGAYLTPARINLIWRMVGPK